MIYTILLAVALVLSFPAFGMEGSIKLRKNLTLLGKAVNLERLEERIEALLATNLQDTTLLFRAIEEAVELSETSTRTEANAIILRALRYMVEAGKDPRAIVTPGNRTLLYAASRNNTNNPALVKLLLLFNIDPNARCKGNVSPLMNAISSLNPETVQYLLKGGAEVTKKELRRSKNAIEASKNDPEKLTRARAIDELLRQSRAIQAIQMPLPQINQNLAQPLFQSAYPHAYSYPAIFGGGLPENMQK